MRTVLIGAVGSTEVVLRALQDAGYPPVLLATLAPDIGRKRHADYVDLSALATEATEVLHIENSSDSAFVEQVHVAQPDIIMVIGWSQVVHQELRDAARWFTVGFHPTLLPAMRGRAVIGWTILLGLEETGTTLFVIDEGVDSGPILAQDRFSLDPRETVASLSDKVVRSLDRMLRDVLPRLIDGTAQPRPQSDEGASYCAKRTAADGLIDWTRPAAEIDRLIRASGRPYAGAFTFTSKRRLMVWAAEPCPAAVRFHAAPGQVVDYRDGDPIVLCGDGALLRIAEYEASDGRPLTGQVRLRPAMAEDGELA